MIAGKIYGSWIVLPRGGAWACMSGDVVGFTGSYEEARLWAIAFDLEEQAERAANPPSKPSGDPSPTDLPRPPP